MHADGNNPGIEAGMKMLGPPVDRAVSAFLEDVEARGLSEKVLLVITGDFGRTPRVNKRGGRDHWSSLCTAGVCRRRPADGAGHRPIGRGGRRAELRSDRARPTCWPRSCTSCSTCRRSRLVPGVPRTIAAALEAGRPIAELI